MSEDVESVENLQIMGEDFIKLKADLDKLEPFYLRALRTLNLNSLYVKTRKKWILKKHKAQAHGVMQDDVLLFETFTTVDKIEKEAIVENGFKRV